MEKNSVPYLVHEGSMARMDRIIKRLWITVIVLIVLLVATNAGWIYYESQFEMVEEKTTVTQDADGNSDNTFIGGDNNGGETKGD